MFSKTFLALSSVLAAATASVLPLELRQNDICLPGEGVPTVFITNFVVINPVLINQFFDSNTVINIFGGDDITINNAPTYISTIVSATATTTSTVTATTTATATATATATTLPFVLGVEPVGVAKRQLSSSFIGGSGSTVGTCSSAVLFTIEAGQLFSGGEILSTTVSAQQQLFGVSSAGGSINTTFSAPSGSFLTWQNPAFTGGFAIFSAEAGSNFVNFNGAFPAGNVGINLLVIPASSCVSGSSSSSSIPTSSLVPTTSASSNSSTSATSTSSGSSTSSLTSSFTSSSITTSFSSSSSSTSSYNFGNSTTTS